MRRYSEEGKRFAVNRNLSRFRLSHAWGSLQTLSGDNALLLRVESLNLLNHPQFAEPGSSLTGRNFGVISNTLNDGRTLTFTLRFQF